MDLLIIRQALVLIASAIAAYTDYKTGFVFDWLTYPLIATGILLNVFEQQWTGLVLGAAVFAIGYAFYFAGKIGGGDVKQFTGIALMLPFFGNGIYILNAVFLSAILAVVCFTVYYGAKYLLKNGIELKENKQGILNAILLGAFFVLYLWFIFQLGVLSLFTVGLIGMPLLFGLVFVAFEKGIRKEFFLKKISVAKLEEDELIATEFEKKETLKLLDLKLKGVLGKKEIEKLKKAKIKEVFVYRNAPRFAPFFFLGCVAAIVFPNLLQLLFIRL